MEWKLADAKNRLSELINRVAVDGPQRIRRHGDAFIVISERDYLRLVGDRPSLKTLLLNGPALDDLHLDRDASPMRDGEL